ncbi:UNVERIFIED_CONTAM: hypothetical protein NCL1_52621 [Trichonephila clavipes]
MKYILQGPRVAEHSVKLIFTHSLILVTSKSDVYIPFRPNPHDRADDGCGPCFTFSGKSSFVFKHNENPPFLSVVKRYK